MRLLHCIPGALLLLNICGCAGLNSRPGNALAITAIEPASPAHLKFGERMLVHIHYSVTNADPVIILARPYTHGEKTDGYNAHPSYRYPAGSGDIVGWFYFDTPARVQEVRVDMLTARTRQPVASISQAINASWQ